MAEETEATPPTGGPKRPPAVAFMGGVRGVGENLLGGAAAMGRQASVMTAGFGAQPSPRDEVVDEAVLTAKAAHREKIKALRAEATNDTEDEDQTPRPLYIINPTGSFRVSWDLFTLVLLVYVAIVVPYREGFDVEPKGNWYWFEFAIDMAFLTDCALNFFTAYTEGDAEHGERLKEVSGLGKIACRYLKGWFWIDFFSSLPWDLLMKGMSSFRALKVAKLGRVLKVAKMLRFSKIMRLSQERATELEELMLSASTASAVKLLTLLAAAVACAHVLACLWAFCARIAGERSTWMEAYYDADDTATDPVKYWKRGAQYLVGFYWAITTMSTVGYGDICPESNLERAVAILAMCIGGAFYGYIVASIASIVQQSDSNARAYYEKMDTIHTYMAVKRFPKQLRHRVHRYFKRYFEQRTALDETAILNDLEPALRRAVHEHILHEGVRRSFLFTGQRADVHEQIFENLVVEQVERGQVITEKGKSLPMCLYFINEGSCELEGELLHAGDLFGELVALGLETEHRHTVTSAESGMLQKLSREKLSDIFKPLPNELAKVVELALDHDLAREEEMMSPTKKTAAMSPRNSGATLAGGGNRTLPPGFADVVTTTLKQCSKLEDQITQVSEELTTEISELRDGFAEQKEMLRLIMNHLQIGDAVGKTTKGGRAIPVEVLGENDDAKASAARPASGREAKADEEWLPSCLGTVDVSVEHEDEKASEDATFAHA